MHEKFDIVVGLPSYNEYDSIAKTVRQIDRGLQEYLGNYRALIVNVDNSPDEKTKEAFLNTKTRAPKHYIHTKAAHGHKGSNLKKLFSFFLKTDARALAILDADLTSSDPVWMKFLFEPVLKKKIDHVFPFYRRHQCDGSITNFICYPIMVGVLGRAIRQPIGGEMSFSRKAVANFMRWKWPLSAHRFGIDIFMTLCSVFSGMKLGQVYLGVKRHKPSGPKLNDMFIDVVDTLFAMLRAHKDKWGKKLMLREYPILNPAYKQARNGHLEINENVLRSWASASWKDEHAFIEKLLPESNVIDVVKDGVVDSEEWAVILWRFILSPCSVSSLRLARALRPLYFMRFLSYCASRPKSYEGSMRVVERQARLIFENRTRFLSQKTRH